MHVWNFPFLSTSVRAFIGSAFSVLWIFGVCVDVVNFLMCQLCGTRRRNVRCSNSTSPSLTPATVPSPDIFRPLHSMVNKVMHLCTTYHVIAFVIAKSEPTLIATRTTTCSFARSMHSTAAKYFELNTIRQLGIFCRCIMLLATKRIVVRVARNMGSGFVVAKAMRWWLG